MRTNQRLLIVFLCFAICVTTQQGIKAKAQNIPSEKIILKCTTSSGEPAGSLEIDLHNKVMTWAQNDYSITSVTDHYISAYQRMDDEVGGETWVLDRTNGNYLRAAVMMFCDTRACNHQQLNTATYRGVCSRGLF